MVQKSIFGTLVLSLLMNTMEARDVQLIRWPESVTIRNKEFLELYCEFSNPVNCLWMRHGQPLEISARYQYIKNHKGHNTTDCSIRIGPTKKIDYDDWSCQNVVTNDDPLVKSKTIKIVEHITNDLLAFHNNSKLDLNKIELIEGSTVTVQCSSSLTETAFYRWEICTQNSTFKECKDGGNSRNISLTDSFFDKWIKCWSNGSGSWVSTDEYHVVRKVSITLQDFSGNGYFITSCVLIGIVTIIMVLCSCLIWRFCKENNRSHYKENLKNVERGNNGVTSTKEKKCNTKITENDDGDASSTKELIEKERKSPQLMRFETEEQNEAGSLASCTGGAD